MDCGTEREQDKDEEIATHLRIAYIYRYVCAGRTRDLSLLIISIVISITHIKLMFSLLLLLFLDVFE